MFAHYKHLLIIFPLLYDTLTYSQRKNLPFSSADKTNCNYQLSVNNYDYAFIVIFAITIKHTTFIFILHFILLLIL